MIQHLCDEQMENDADKQFEERVQESQISAYEKYQSFLQKMGVAENLEQHLQYSQVGNEQNNVTNDISAANMNIQNQSQYASVESQNIDLATQIIPMSASLTPISEHALKKKWNQD